MIHFITVAKIVLFILVTVNSIYILHTTNPKLFKDIKKNIQSITTLSSDKKQEEIEITNAIRSVSTKTTVDVMSRKLKANTIYDKLLSLHPSYYKGLDKDIVMSYIVTYLGESSDRNISDSINNINNNVKSGKMKPPKKPAKKPPKKDTVISEIHDLTIKINNDESIPITINNNKIQSNIINKTHNLIINDLDKDITITFKFLTSKRNKDKTIVIKTYDKKKQIISVMSDTQTKKITKSIEINKTNKTKTITINKKHYNDKYDIYFEILYKN